MKSLSGRRTGAEADERTSCSWKRSSDNSRASSSKAWIASRVEDCSTREPNSVCGGRRFEAVSAFWKRIRASRSDSHSD
jgi:hypothetical protein